MALIHSAPALSAGGDQSRLGHLIVTITRSIREALTDQGGKSAGDRRSGNRSGSSRGAGEDPDRSQVSEFGERALRFAEDVVYVAVAILLVVGALVLLVDAAGELAGLGEGADSAVLALLDRLLLVFVLVELIFAVRMTLSRREIVAEPFLIVGIIASIKEIVVLSVKAAESIGSGASFRDQLWQIGVLGVVVLLLGTTAWLLRRKEREPEEGAQRA